LAGILPAQSLGAALLDTIQIRYALAEDASVVVDLFRAIVDPLDIYTRQARDGEIARFSIAELQSRIARDPKSVALAFIGQSAAGFSITDDQHGPIWIEWYGVDPGIRGAGIGRALIHSLIKQAPTRGATKLWCDTRVNNVSSIALFEHAGFTRLCELKNHWYGQDFFLWERNL